MSSILLLALFLSTSAGGQDREYQMKAEFLERFTRFIDWPKDSAVANPSTPFSICVIGNNPYGSYLRDLASVARIQKKEILIQEISNMAQIQSCDLLFIGSSEKPELNSILKYTSQRPILTVSDSSGYADRGVLINFYKDRGYIRFEINTRAVQKSRLKFSSRLLKLGRLIKTASKEGEDRTP